MLGGVVAVLICVWFYHSASKNNINPLPWIVGALIVYYGAKVGWTYGVVKPLMGGGAGRRGMTALLMIEVSGSLIGAACAAWFRSNVMLKQAGN